MSGVQEVKNASAGGESVSLLLAGSLCLVPFLLPYHQLPILSFQAEWLSAALGIGAVLAAFASRRSSGFTAVPLPARWLIAFALFLAVQALAGHSNYPQRPLSGALYVLYAVLLFWLGAQLAVSVGTERVAIILAAWLLTGALANAAAGVIQFYGRPALLEDVVAELRLGPQHNGAYGNIAQSNLYVNYIALGGTALLFLWWRRSLRTVYAVAAALLLAYGSALSGSRSALLYPLWLMVLGVVAGRFQAGAAGRSLKCAAYGLAATMLAAQLAIPWLNHMLELGPPNKGAFERLVQISGAQGDGRWQAWLLALRVFADAPVFGAGIGEFAGAAFESGLAPQMAAGEVWTSPHNLPLQLLAETGALGAVLALGGLCIWCWQAGRRYFAAPQAAMWWIIAAVGVELIHSMVEYPLWNAHFLGVTALLMGLGTAPRTLPKRASRPIVAAGFGICAVLALALALLLRDYLRLDATRATGTAMTLASAADTARDVAVMRALARGPLAPTAELWIILGAPLDRGALAGRLEMSARVARHFPSNAVVVRRAVFLAFDGQASAARSLLARALRSFPQRCRQTSSILQQARNADPGAIDPLLHLARDAGGLGCS
ncbi:MAG: O-antigen ligase C-terminal domain-containing protein [Burkholderiales bacterium]|nr:O-antigen ligase C-terminal domain-containing protein [Burkholderiales bacterium]